jgi:D-alanyl-D-alanine carboxypeptidase (penicillin-binding protein 5/6)
MNSRRSFLLSGAALLAAGPVFGKPRKAVHAAPKEATPKDAAKPAGDDEEGSASDTNAPVGAPAESPVGPVPTSAQWAFITDFDTGAVLLDKASDVEMPPSSMTKLMTAYIVYSRLKAGSLHLDQMLPVSEHAWRTQGSKMFVEINGTIKVEDLIRGMIIQSGNDACIVLAEGIAGTEEQFVELMNAEAKRLGLTKTYFRNCTGWPDPQHHMSARDIATLARAIIRDFPEYYHFDSEKQYTYHGIVQYNRNPLVQAGLADGLKTGHTDAGGYGVVASAKRDGRRVIMVLNGMPSKGARKQESIRLIGWAFANFENVRLFAASDVVESAPVYLGTRASVPLVGGQDVVMTLPRAWKARTKVVVDYDGPIPAPVNRGDVVGKIVVTTGSAAPLEIPLLAGEDVPRLGVVGRAAAVLAHYATGA